MVGYNYSKSDVADAKAQTGLGLSVGFQIYIPSGINKKFKTYTIQEARNISSFFYFHATFLIYFIL